MVGSGGDLRSGFLMGDKIKGVEEADAILFVGTNPRYEAPVFNARVRKTWMHYEVRIGMVGSKVDLTYEYDFLGSDAKALYDLIAGHSDFAKVRYSQSSIDDVGLTASYYYRANHLTPNRPASSLSHPYSYLLRLKALKGASRPLIIVGSRALKGSQGPALLATLHTLADGLRTDPDWQVPPVHPPSASPRHRNRSSWLQCLNVLHATAGLAGALDLGYKGSGLADATPELLFLLGADEGAVAKPKDAFVVYQGWPGGGR